MMTAQDTLFTLSDPKDLFAQCPTFNLLVLGNPESTKLELFTKLFGVDVEKFRIASAFAPTHGITSPLELNGANPRLTIFTSANFSDGSEPAYASVLTFLEHQLASSTPIHCIWYCVAADPKRPVHALETRFLREDLPRLSAQTRTPIPTLLVFTKYDAFVSDISLAWSHHAADRGLSKVAVSHILPDLAARKFEEQIGERWDAAIGSGGLVTRVCVASDDEGSFERLAAVQMASLKDAEGRRVWAAAQRNAAAVAMQVCAELASEYFAVGTGHARKVHGVDMRDILPNFLAKAAQIFNLRDDDHVLVSDTPALLEDILNTIFDDDRLPFLDSSLTATQPGILNSLTPHERACLLAQALAGITLFFTALAEREWPARESSPLSLRKGTIERVLDDLRAGPDRKEVLETIEASSVFTHCRLLSEVSDLIVKAVEGNKMAAHKGHTGRGLVVDDAELEEISLSFVNDKGPDDMVLPNGLRILPLN